MKSVSKNEIKLLWARVLTRSGDQAWDFVVPFALLHIFPGRLQIAALYYLIMKMGGFLLTPSIGKWIDSNQRKKIIQAGVFLQFAAVLGGFICFSILDRTVHRVGAAHAESLVVFLFVILSGLGILAAVGSMITDLCVGNDLAPALVESGRLTNFNSWFRRIDLGTELGAPIIAGLLFSLELSSIHLAGLMIVALWNLISFFPEYLLLMDVIGKSGLHTREINAVKSWKELFQFNLKKSLAQPIFWLIASYAFLWLSVLSPHGVLLSGYLNDKMQLPEAEIGIFRSLGALFGLLSTLTFPYLVKKYGLISSSKAHLCFQGLVLIFGLFAFQHGSVFGIYGFLLCILLSRVGLYGFSNGEFELRQRLIPENQRGELNSLSSMLTTFAGLFLYAAGSLLPGTDDFKYLVYMSVAAVIAANLVFFRWAKNNSSYFPRTMLASYKNQE